MTLDLYQVLDVHPRATGEEIKKAFRRVALSCHPDRNAQNRQAEERFKDANFAYSILGDPQRRRRYDLYRSFRIHSADIGWVVPPSRVYEKILEDFFMNAPIPWMGTPHPFAMQAMAGFRRLFSTPWNALVFLKRLLRALEQEGFFRSPGGKAGGVDPGQAASSESVRVPGRRFFTGQGFGRSRGRVPDQARTMNRKAPMTPHRNGDREQVLALAPQEAQRGTVVTVSLLAGTAWERVRVRIPPGVRDGIRLRVRHKGVPAREGSTERGDLYLRLRVV